MKKYTQRDLDRVLARFGRWDGDPTPEDVAGLLATDRTVFVKRLKKLPGVDQPGINPNSVLGMIQALIRELESGT